MYIQEQLRWDQVNDENLAFFKAIGVDYLAIYPAPDMRDGADRADYWWEMRKLAEKHGLTLRNIATHGWDEITLAKPDRDEKIEAWCTILRNLGEVGIPTMGYNFKPIGNFRTTSAIGRGGVRYSTFDYDELMQNPPHVPEKAISAEDLRANLAYFLERVMPVAEQSGVRMALHPDDPPLSEPLGGAARVVSSIEDYLQIFDMYPTASNAMLFCQGCVAEMGVDVEQAIRTIGGLDKIVYVHFRNIRGTPRNFQEVFVDEGQVDMRHMMEVYRDIGFNGPFMMDHTPTFSSREQTKWGGVAFAVGYMRGLIHSVYR
jgi:mannonate dehydratase